MTTIGLELWCLTFLLYFTFPPHLSVVSLALQSSLLGLVIWWLLGGW